MRQVKEFARAKKAKEAAKEEAPLHDQASLFTTVALRTFGPTARSRVENHPMIGQKLEQAGIGLVPIAYLSSVYLQVAIASACGFLLFTLYVIINGANADPSLTVALLASTLILGAMTYAFQMFLPDIRIGQRAKQVEENLPYALNFMAAMSSAGVIPVKVFETLGKQPVYGMVAQQCSLVYRDTSLFNKDLLQALRRGSFRSPSKQFAEFLQGAITTVTSGGDLSVYFLAKSEHYAQENHRKHRAFIESMGVMAESYVVVAAAAPLFLIVILTVMLLLSETEDPTLFLNAVVLLAMPIVHGMFIYILRTMKPE